MDMHFRADIFREYEISGRCDFIVMSWKYNVVDTLREILLVVLTKRSQLYIFSKRYQKCCTHQYLKVDGAKYATNFFL